MNKSAGLLWSSLLYCTLGSLFVAYDLEWDRLEMDDGEEIRVHTFTFDQDLAATTCI